MTGQAPAPSEMLAAWRLDQVTRESMIGWVETLRDDNPIHVDPQVAEALGYGPRTVNPGPANLAYALNMVLEACPGSYPVTIKARFLGNVLSDDGVEVTGEKQADGRCHVVLRITDGGDPALELEVVMRQIDE